MSMWMEFICGVTGAESFENVVVLVAIAVNEDGYREALGAAEGMKEDNASWISFFQWLRGRGQDGVKLVAKMLKAIHAQECKKLPGRKLHETEGGGQEGGGQH